MLEFGRGVPVKPQRVRKRPAIRNHQHVEQRVIVGEAGELAHQPGHQVDADRRHLALAGAGEERAPALGRAVENGDAQMREVRPERDF